MNYITVGKEHSRDINLYFEDHGEGKPVVMIHGFPLSGAAWEKQVLALLAAGYRTITYDRRGFGRSSQPIGGYDYNTFASDLNMLMEQLDIHDAILIGHSMGTGEIARYLSTYGADRVDKAIYIAPIPPFFLKTADNPEGKDQSFFDEIIQRIKSDRFAYISQFLNGFYNIDGTSNKLVSDEAVRFSWNIASKASPTGTISCVTAWQTDFRKDLPKLSAPSLIIQGDADQILPFSLTGKRMHADLPGSKLVVIPDGPHGIPWTHAEQVNKEIISFLS